MANAFCKQLIVNQFMMTMKTVMTNTVCWQKHVIMNAAVTMALPVLVMMVIMK